MEKTHPEELNGLNYIAPEFIEDGLSLPAMDLYAFGCVIFEMITGRKPF